MAMDGVKNMLRSRDGELPGIAAISHFGHWIDEFTLTFSSVLMTFALILISVNSITDNRMMNNPIYTLFTLVLIGVGIETVGRTILRRSKMSWEDGKRLASVLWAVAALPPLAAAFILVSIFFLVRTISISQEEAMRMLNIQPVFWAFGRSVVFVYLIVLSIFADYREHVAKKRAMYALPAPRPTPPTPPRGGGRPKFDPSTVDSIESIQLVPASGLKGQRVDALKDMYRNATSRPTLAQIHTYLASKGLDTDSNSTISQAGTRAQLELQREGTLPAWAYEPRRGRPSGQLQAVS